MEGSVSVDGADILPERIIRSGRSDFDVEEVHARSRHLFANEDDGVDGADEDPV